MPLIVRKALLGLSSSFEITHPESVNEFVLQISSVLTATPCLGTLLNSSKEEKFFTHTFGYSLGRYSPTQEVRIREILFSKAFCPKSETVNVNQAETDDDAEKNAEEHLNADNDEERVQDLVLLEENCSEISYR